MNDYRLKDDRELVMLLQQGDRPAFEVIYRRYASPLFKYVGVRVERREDAEEILQEAFVWLWAKRENLSHVTDLRPYLYGIVKNKIFNHIRHSLIKKRYAEHYNKFESIQDNSNEESHDLTDIRTVIDQSIAQLPERCQMAFRLSRIEHQPIANIAAQMNISTRTVENYITQALKHLRIACGDYYKAETE